MVGCYTRLETNTRDLNSSSRIRQIMIMVSRQLQPGRNVPVSRVSRATGSFALFIQIRSHSRLETHPFRTVFSSDMWLAPTL